MDKQAIIKALRDTAQSASNAAAGNVSAPIDAIAWALRKAGVNMPNPVGGSEWMQSKGLTAPVDEGVPKMAGDVIGNLIPAIGFAKAPQIARGMNRMVDNAMAPATMNKQRGAVVWHGSPSKFDSFDAAKIGSGEGNQAYGYGSYFAESPEVAKTYATNGNLYKADIPDEQIAKMLDWEKPMSQQPENVRNAFNLNKFPENSPIHNMTGMEAYVRYGNRFGEPTSSSAKTANAFSDLGIPGVRYLDEVSRKAGSGTSNFVVFPKNLDQIKVLESKGLIK